jgi:hypothetical protein
MLALVGVLVTLISTLVGYIFVTARADVRDLKREFIRNLDKLCADAVVLRQRVDSSDAVADNASVQQRLSVIEKELEYQRENTRRFRHEEYAPKYQMLVLEVNELKIKVDNLERQAR